jgi:hypothetical protein
MRQHPRLHLLQFRGRGFEISSVHH